MKVIVLDYNTGKVHIHNNPNTKIVLSNYEESSIKYMGSLDNEFEIVYHEE